MISQTTIYFILKKHRGGFLSIPSLDCPTLQTIFNINKSIHAPYISDKFIL